MNEKEGWFVLSEILKTGNFGSGEKRYNFKRMKTLCRMTVHGAHLLLHYPSEVLWTPSLVGVSQVMEMEQEKKTLGNYILISVYGVFFEKNPEIE